MPTRQTILENILNLSNRISSHSATMKPFIRFSEQTKAFWKKCNNKTFYWDFDNTLQKVLFKLVCNLNVSPQQLDSACIEQWESNNKNFIIGKEKQLAIIKNDNTKPQFGLHPRMRMITDNIKKGGRILYVGCGTGVECIAYASYGYNVVGVDTNQKAVDIANEWADYLNLPFKAICMDVMALDLKSKSFDGFLLEFYGYQSSLAQTLTLQKNLANILNDQGKGFFVASRKKYTSYWFLMGSPYPRIMTDWLKQQSMLDCLFSQQDGVEEKLNYGLYYKSHTIDSLSFELKNSFKVLDCRNDEDPRYEICIVKNKEKNSQEGSTTNFTDYALDQGGEGADLNAVDIKNILYKIEFICNILEIHAKEVFQLFCSRSKATKEPLSAIKTDLSEFIFLLAGIAEDTARSLN